MTITFRKAKVSFGLLAIAFTCSPTSAGGISSTSSKEVKSKHMAPIPLVSANIGQVATWLAREGIPAGVATPWNTPPFSVSFKGGTAEEFLTQILAPFPDYQWQEQDGTILIFPSDPGTSDPMGILRSTVPYFKASDYDAGFTLSQLESHAAAAGLKVSHSRFSQEAIQRNSDDVIESARINITIASGTPLIVCLNRIAANDGHGFWWARVRDDGKLMLTGGSVKNYSGRTVKQEREIARDKREGRIRRGTSVYSEGKVDE